jgi:medium-chain acyl-[acyl-carrier-protein] hydrolase
MYLPWIGQLGPEVDVIPVQLPGRETRLVEAAPYAMSELIEPLVAGLRPLLDRPFAFCGHSMGALVAFEAARHLRVTHGRELRHLFVSGRRAPHLKNDDPPIHQLPEPSFLEELRRLDGTPDEVLGNRDLMRVLLPTLRADFALCETYEYHADTPLDCPTAVLGGLDDADVPWEDLEGWREHTRNRCVIHEFAGGHFFLHTAREAVLRVVLDELIPTLARTPALR